jgi:inhibitor of cysteine peptidase
MVQKEVMKKTRNYGLIGVLLAVLLVATIYSYGVTPGISPTPFPNVSPTDAPPVENNVSPMKTFASYSELRDYLGSSNTNDGSNYWRFTNEADTGAALAPTQSAPIPSAAPVAAEVTTNTKDYSTTNIQVEGVDEADSVKTDGNYLYVIGDNGQVVYVLDANPQNAKVLSKIVFNNTYIDGIYLSEDGSKLAVIGNQYTSYYFVDEKVSAGYATDLALPYWNSGTTFVYVYNLSNKANPTLARNFTMSGYYVNSRMIGNYVYSIITESAYVVNQTVILPSVFNGRNVSNVDPTKIYYAQSSDSYYSYTTVACLNIMNDAQQPTNMTIMMGGAGTIYVSPSNIYVTYPDTKYETITQPTPYSTATVTRTPADLGKDNSSQSSPIMPDIMPIMVRPIWQGTYIYRIQVSGASLTFAAKGNVTGNVLNQYAMDESNGYFRIVTTAYEYTSPDSWMGTQQNNVYALDMNLNVVGKLENLGTGENFHSARFMGNRLYMVTFQNTDPLFVVDLSQPTNIRLLGELVMPGYSDYLHPYDETHLIGLGKDAIADQGTNFAWYQGLKLSLFDVSNINAPREVAKMIIGDRGTSSPALYDPKAFLFDKTQNLLVIPVELHLIDNTTSSQQNKLTPATNGSATIMPIAPPFIGSGSTSSQYGQFVWQGAYIFNVSIEGGFVVKGNVTQFDNATALMSDPSLPIRGDYQWLEYNHYITRSLYIGNVLYTFSEGRVQLNSLDNFTLIAKIDLQ